MVELPPPDAAERAFLLECVGADRLETFLSLCTQYGELLYETNESLNLTAIPPESYWSKHVCDCVLALRALPELFVDGVRLADVGCGAGLPAFPQSGPCTTAGMGARRIFRPAAKPSDPPTGDRR